MNYKEEKILTKLIDRRREKVFLAIVAAELANASRHTSKDKPHDGNHSIWAYIVAPPVSDPLWIAGVDCSDYSAQIGHLHDS